MTGKELTLKGLQRYLRALPKELEKAVVRGLRTGAQRGIAIAIASGDSAPPASPNGKPGAFDTGEYRRSWKAKNLKDGAILYNSSRQAPIIERGRRRGRRMPPLKVIARFAERKLGLSKADAKHAAYPIARAIARRGLAARWSLRRAEPKIVTVVLQEVHREVSETLRKTAETAE